MSKRLAASDAARSAWMATFDLAQNIWRQQLEETYCVRKMCVHELGWYPHGWSVTGIRN